MDNNQMQGGGPGRPQGPGGQKQPDNGRNKNNGKKQGGGKSILVFLVITLIVMLATNIVTSMVKDTTEREITYNQFINMVDRGEVESVEIGSNRIDINLKNQPIPGVKITCYTGIMDDPTLTDRLLKAGVYQNRTGQFFLPDLKYRGKCSAAGYDRIYFLLFHASYGIRRRSHGCRQEQGKSLRREGNRCDLPGCCRTG